jgi:succinate dehydrogenase/fumarate reductase flavoprotein subunit
MIRPGGGDIKPFLADGYLTEGATLDELARNLGIDAEGLKDSVARMNRYAEAGIDADFQRGTTVYEKANGDPAHGPNPTLGKLEIAPFYAVKLWPGDIGSAMGLVGDQHARLLRRDGSVIEGLYACGNDLQSIMGGVYPGPGITVGPAIVFGAIAARHAAARSAAAHRSKAA